MESIDVKCLDLTIEESRDIINFIAQKGGVSTEKLLSTIKPNLKCKNNEILTTKTQQKAAKIHQKAAKCPRLPHRVGRENCVCWVRDQSFILIKMHLKIL